MRSRVTSIGLVGAAPPSGYAYPHHIDRSSIEALPPKPGIYRFLDAAGRALYIGKSIHLRSRVRAHLRAPEEAAMLAQTCRIDHVCTAGEVGALLLELQLIRAQQPPFNCLLKEEGEVFSLVWQPGQPIDVVASSAVRKGLCSYGVYASRWSAWDGLRALLKRHRLCPAAAGLETPVRGRGCFSWQTGRCAGACIGKETVQEHNARFQKALASLQEAMWPFPGAIGIREELDGWRQTHVIDHWCYLGSLEGGRTRVKTSSRPPFDIDIYKILMRPLLLGELEVVPYPAERMGTTRLR